MAARFPDSVTAVIAHEPPMFAVEPDPRSQATNRYYGRPAGVLAEKLDTPLLVFPGHHMSYFDLPTSWTDTLRTTLHTIGSR